VTIAADPQDIDRASCHILRGVLFLEQALGASDLQLASSEGVRPLQLHDKDKAALRQLHQTGPGSQTLTWLTGSIQDWEQLVCDSFQCGRSVHLDESTIKQQVRSGVWQGMAVQH